MDAGLGEALEAAVDPDQLCLLFEVVWFLATVFPDAAQAFGDRRLQEQDQIRLRRKAVQGKDEVRIQPGRALIGSGREVVDFLLPGP